MLALLLSLGQSEHAGHLIEVKGGDRAQVTSCLLPTSGSKPSLLREGSGSPAVTSRWAHFQSAVRMKKEHGPLPGD